MYMKWSSKGKKGGGAAAVGRPRDAPAARKKRLKTKRGPAAAAGSKKRQGRARASLLATAAPAPARPRAAAAARRRRPLLLRGQPRLFRGRPAAAAAPAAARAARAAAARRLARRVLLGLAVLAQELAERGQVLAEAEGVEGPEDVLAADGLAALGLALFARPVDWVSSSFFRRFSVVFSSFCWFVRSERRVCVCGRVGG